MGYIIRTQIRIKEKNINKIKGLTKRKGKLTSYISIDYPSFVDSIKMRLYFIKSRLNFESEHIIQILEYTCFRCLSSFNSHARKQIIQSEFEIMEHVESQTGCILCPICRKELQNNEYSSQYPDHNLLLAVKKKEHKKQHKDLINRYHTQLKLIIDQLNKLDESLIHGHVTFINWTHKKRNEKEKSNALTAKINSEVSEMVYKNINYTSYGSRIYTILEKHRSHIKAINIQFLPEKESKSFGEVPFYITEKDIMRVWLETAYMNNINKLEEKIIEKALPKIEPNMT